jgi:hypothetical protein
MPVKTFAKSFPSFPSQSRQSAKLFRKSSELGLPQPLTRRRVCPPLRSWWEGHIRWRESGVGRVPIPTRGHTCTLVVLFIYTYFVCTLVCAGSVRARGEPIAVPLGRGLPPRPLPPVPRPPAQPQALPGAAAAPGRQEHPTGIRLHTQSR